MTGGVLRSAISLSIFLFSCNPVAARLSSSRSYGSLTLDDLISTVVCVIVVIGGPLLAWLFVSVLCGRKCLVLKRRRSKHSTVYMYKYCVARRGLCQTPARKNDPCLAPDPDAICGSGMNIDTEGEWTEYGVDSNDQPIPRTTTELQSNPLRHGAAGHSHGSSSHGNRGSGSGSHGGSHAGMPKSAPAAVPAYAYGAQPVAGMPGPVPGQMYPQGAPGMTMMPAQPMPLPGQQPYGAVPQAMPGTAFAQPNPGAPYNHYGQPMVGAGPQSMVGGGYAGYVPQDPTMPIPSGGMPAGSMGAAPVQPQMDPTDDPTPVSVAAQMPPLPAQVGLSYGGYPSGEAPAPMPAAQHSMAL